MTLKHLPLEVLLAAARELSEGPVGALLDAHPRLQPFRAAFLGFWQGAIDDERAAPADPRPALRSERDALLAEHDRITRQLFFALSSASFAAEPATAELARGLLEQCFADGLAPLKLSALERKAAAAGARSLTADQRRWLQQLVCVDGHGHDLLERKAELADKVQDLSVRVKKSAPKRPNRTRMRQDFFRTWRAYAATVDTLGLSPKDADRLLAPVMAEVRRHQRNRRRRQRWAERKSEPSEVT